MHRFFPIKAYTSLKKNVSCILIFILLLITGQRAFSQTDTEFWFVVPELTAGHNAPALDPAGGIPAFLRFSTLTLAATVTVSMPANPFDPVTNPTGFPDIVLNIPANSTDFVDLSDWIWLAGADVNRLENKNLNASGKNPFGLRIQSTNVITAYYEVSNKRNADIWALKGRNSLGTEFFTPFQTHGVNGNYTPQPYSAIDIVATEDNTTITIVSPVAASYGLPFTTVAANTPIIVTLNRGQTFSLFPQNQSQATANRLRGARITSDKPIAVTLNDDSILHTSGGCRDVVGDQLVPVNILGVDYIAIRTFLNTHDHVYITATQPNTPIYINGNPVPVEILANPGDQHYYQMTATSRISSRLNATDPYKPFYVFHIGSATNGCEQGGAILPPIDICTGSTQVAFTRPNNSEPNFSLIMMVRDGAQNNFYFNGVLQTGAPGHIINPAAFILVPGTPWRAARFGPFGTGVIAEAQHLITNDEDIFHLGILNGAGSTTCFYGYFSDYNQLEVGAVVAGTGSTILKTCYGTPVQLYATGGTNFRWSPGESLSDSTIQAPFANPEINTQYSVVVDGACDLTDTAYVNVLVSLPINAYFATDRVTGCAPLEVNFTDLSEGVYSWQYDFGDGTAYLLHDLDASTPALPPPNPFVFSHIYENNTALPIDYTITLLAKNADFCNDIYTKIITVYPSINADYNQNIVGAACDNPREVQFTNQSSNNTVDTYQWDFGDGFNRTNTIHNDVFTHNFENLNPFDTTYQVRMIAISPFACRDTATSSVYVTSFFEPQFQVSTNIGCQPLDVMITNYSLGDTASYTWTISPDPGGPPLPGNGAPFSVSLPNTGAAQITYTIRLTIENTDGCTKFYEQEVIVYPQIIADFTPIPDEGCYPLSVEFQNNSTGAASYFWDFGDGGSSFETNPVHAYERNLTNNTITYTVKLLSISADMCVDSVFHDVDVHPFIEAAFTVDNVIGCHPFDITINNVSTGVDTYTWDFGDGTPVSNSSDPVINHTYSNTTGTTQIYPLTLIVENNQGCVDTLVRDISVYTELTANFLPDVFSGCHPLTVEFTDLSLNAVSYYWEFGDGASSTEPEPLHTFTNYGTIDSTYTVTLVTTSGDGLCVKSVSWPIVVHGVAIADFTFSEALNCGPFEVTFENHSIGEGLEYTWNFGDGTIINTNSPDPVTHTFTNASFTNIEYFNVTLFVENYAGCTDSVIKTVGVYPDIRALFNSSVTGGCHPLTVDFTNQSDGELTYSWNFGDGSSSSLENPSHTFTNTGTVDSVYNVSLYVLASNNLCWDTISVDITVHPYLKAEFTVPLTLDCNPFDVVLENSSVNATIFRWDFGDGQDTITYNLDPFVHRFNNPDFNNQQDYEITLIAENYAGCTSELRRTITVQPDIVADFTASQTMGCHPLTVDFAPVLPNGAASYLWDFGDGSSSSLENPSHTFTNTGTVDSVYTVSLYVLASNNLCWDTISVDITVHPYLKAEFTVPLTLDCNPFDVVLENSSVNATIFRWDFGDGQDTITYNLDPFVHRFNNPDFNNQQDYEITLIAENYAGCTSELRRTITVQPDIIADFTASQTMGCHPLMVDFAPVLPNGAASYLWEFGDGNISSSQNPSRIFTNYGSTDTTYTVRLTVTADNLVCSDTFDLDIVVHAFVKAEFTFEDNLQCSPSSVILNNHSIGGSDYTWSFDDGTPDFSTSDINPFTHPFNNTDFNNTATFQVTLTTRNYAGCTDVITRNIEVLPAIQAAFSVDIAEGCHPLLVNFTNESDGGFTYLWDFGDGSFTSTVSPSHTFTNYSNAPITRQVRLRATSQYNCVSEATVDITIQHKPLAQYDVDNVISCPPFELSISNTSLNADNYTWIFGDGNTFNTVSTDPFVHTYTNDSPDIVDYDLRLIAETTYGCQDAAQQKIFVYPSAIAAFSSETEGCSPLTVGFTNESVRGITYFWDFGDGTSIGVKDPTHVYYNLSVTDTVFKVILTTQTEYGCLDTDSTFITVYPQPRTEFSALPTHQIFPSATVALTNETNPGFWSFLWNMGDGFTTTVRDPAPYTYAGPGEYEITLYATSGRCEDSVSHRIRIFPAPPIADFDSIIPGCVPLAVQFRNNSLYGDTYYWDFDDGNTSTEFEPVHTFTEAGIYNVRLTVTGPGGREYAYRIVEVYHLPVVKFSVAPILVMLPDQEIQTFNMTEYGETYLWDFGDGNTSTQVSPRHLYTQTGFYDIGLTAWTENGCSAELIQERIVEVVAYGDIVYPSAFRPDISGPSGGYYNINDPASNTIFRPHWEGVTEYTLRIYNRWGELLYVSEDVMKGWDGYYQGKLCKQDVYVWKVWVTFTNGKKLIKAGDVTLLR